MSNIEINSGQGVSVGGIKTSTNSVAIKQPSVNVSVTGVIGGTGDAHYTHDQNSASSSWSVSHNLGKKPSVVVVDSADTVLYGHIEYTDLNNLTITLSAPTSGKAYIN